MNINLKASLLLMISTSVWSNTLYVDNSSNCTGLTTCYSSIQEAVNNAISNDEIRVFPGTYVEEIDLSLMGSALGPADDGNIRFVTVDADNNITARTVQVTPLNGPAFTHTGSFFDGNIVFDGLVVVSTDDDGIDLDLVGGDITIKNMTASGSNNDGIDLQVATGGHTMSVFDTITDNNGSHGLNLDGPDGTQSFVQNVQANSNIGEGISIVSINDGDVLDVTIFDSIIQNNGNDLNDSAGIHAWFEGSLTVKNITSNGNRGPGLAIVDATQTSVTDSTFEGNAILEGFSGIFLVSAGMFSVDRSIFSGNGDSGINVYETDIKGNELTVFNVNCSSFTGNQVGVYLNPSAPITANYSLNQNNFSNQTIAGIHAALDNDSIDAINNWWGDASGPTHSDNMAGTGDNVSDSIDDQIGGALGTVNYTSFLTAPITIKQYPSDTLFADDFDGNICSQL